MQTADDGRGPLKFQMLHYVKIQTDPDVICLSATAESALVEAAAAEAPGAGVAGRLEGYCVQLERSSVFAHDKALHALQQLSVCGLPSLASPQHHLQQLGRFLDLGQPALAGALGALVAVLLREGVASRQDGFDDGDGAGAGRVGGGAVEVDRLADMALQG
ncbi:hypothetical protein MNEG_8926 [Monoraphidium neglectum]|uniref:Uncharacterized protein n=1 Tax=Monoraphidium neglectum TaxID=145388 RepID=A0A0D2JI53_9CHLO|nr:hypothetical protein MNEG_8926 [Monoraphidium neglectum]KIY99037.1 hypothetical protein MNEG_8926 [Monoraphidium neglectum]|eukprot:XP_013898057.1 hypothetical protein MNEG_8926 [Monoraphidium neglectum]